MLIGKDHVALSRIDAALEQLVGALLLLLGILRHTLESLSILV